MKWLFILLFLGSCITGSNKNLSVSCPDGFEAVKEVKSNNVTVVTCKKKEDGERTTKRDSLL